MRGFEVGEEGRVRGGREGGVVGLVIVGGWTMLVVVAEVEIEIVGMFTQEGAGTSQYYSVLGMSKVESVKEVTSAAAQDGGND